MKYYYYYTPGENGNHGQEFAKFKMILQESGVNVSELELLCMWAAFLFWQKSGAISNERLFGLNDDRKICVAAEKY